MTDSLPLIIDAALLASTLEDKQSSQQIAVVDIGKFDDFVNERIPGSRHLKYSAIVKTAGDTGGLLPDQDQFQQALRDIGIESNDWIVAHDRTNNLAAARLIWTLHAFGWMRCSLLDGSVAGWQAAGQPLETTNHEKIAASALTLHAQPENSVVMTTDLLLERFDQGSETLIIDARSKDEYEGKDVRARRGGHIPGAQWLEWQQLVDKTRHGMLRSESELRELFAGIGLTDSDSSRPVVAYCQTHQRSSLTYVVLRHLGFENITGLEGAWSDWGNRDDTPIELPA